MIVARPLFIAYAALTAVTALMVAWPPLAILVGILTLGLGVLIPSIWLYVTAMRPGLLVHRSGVHWSLAALVSVIAAAALAIIPARIAAPRAERTLLELTAEDFRKPLPRRPERIELIRDQVAFVRKGDDRVEHAACDEICQHLLLTRQVINRHRHRPCPVRQVADRGQLFALGNGEVSHSLRQPPCQCSSIDDKGQDCRPLHHPGARYRHDRWHQYQRAGTRLPFGPHILIDHGQTGPAGGSLGETTGREHSSPAHH